MDSPRVRETAYAAHSVKEHGAAVFIPDFGRGAHAGVDVKGESARSFGCASG